MPTIQLNGAKIFYEEQGNGSETIVFAHGLLWSGRMFEARRRPHLGFGVVEETVGHGLDHCGPPAADRHRNEIEMHWAAVFPAARRTRVGPQSRLGHRIPGRRIRGGRQSPGPR